MTLSHPSLVTLAAAALALAGCRPAPSLPRAPRAVAVATVRALRSAQPLVLPGVAALAASASQGGRKDYRIELALPEGVRPVGGAAPWVRLPIVLNARVRARVLRQSQGALSLLLAGQVQELNGRGVQVEFNADPAGLYSLDFGALSSPRGIGAQVFVVRGDKARSVPVQLLDLEDDGQALVAGALADGDRVVVRGLDDLLDGDAVRVLPSQEAL